MLLIFTSKLRGKSHPNIRMIHNPEGISVLYWTSTDITFSFLTPSFLSWIIKLSCPLPSPYKPGDFWEMCGWGKGVVQRRKLNNMLRNHSFRTYQPSVVHGCLPALASRVFPPIFKCTFSFCPCRDLHLVVVLQDVLYDHTKEKNRLRCRAHAQFTKNGQSTWSHMKHSMLVLKE